MYDPAEFLGSGKKKKRTKKLSEYNRFVSHFMLQGLSMKQVAAMWRKYKEQNI